MPQTFKNKETDYSTKGVQALGEKFALKPLNAQSWDPLMDLLYKEEKCDLNDGISEIA